MIFQLWNWRPSVSTRRATRKSPLGRSCEYFEQRTLLSASALAPQVVKSVSPNDTPANFAGNWSITSNKGSGDAAITQEGSTIQVHLTFNFQSFDVTCNVTDNHAAGKINSTFLGQPIIGKFKVELNDANHSEGTAKIKKSAEGKLRVSFTAERNGP